MLTLYAVEKSLNNFIAGPVYLQFPTHRFKQPQIVIYCSRYLLKKNLHRNGPSQLKPVLFKAQLYILSCPDNSDMSSRLRTIV